MNTLLVGFVFAATNQLVAALSLLVVSSWLVGLRKPRLTTLIPAILMLITTIAALALQARGFLADGEAFLAITALVLIALAVHLAWEARALLRVRP